MQYELRTQVVEPRRKTFQYLTDRYGDRPASRYEEGSIGIQPTENFHYRPLWAPDRELYGAEWSAVKLTDPYSFTDPRQYYYAPYVANRAELHEAFGNTLKYLEQRNLFARLPQGWHDLIAGLVIPLRHYENGAQLITVTGARFADGTTIEQCCSYAAFDRVGNAQLLSRLGLAVADGSDAVLTGAKVAWTDDAALQGLRRYVEELLVEHDWAVGLFSLDLLDRVLYGVLYRHLDEAALLGGAGAYSLAAQHLSNWFTDQRKWIDALIKAWLADPEHGEANRAVLTAAATQRVPQLAAAVADLAAAADALVGADSVAAAEQGVASLRSALALAGIDLPEENA